MQRGWIGAALAGGVFLVIGGIGGAQAQSAGDADVISFGGGWYDLNDDDDAMDLRLEYRPGVTYFGFVKPWVGIEVTSDGALYGAAGVLADINLTPNIVLTPSLGAGLYSNGGGKDLGRAIQFTAKSNWVTGSATVRGSASRSATSPTPSWATSIRGPKSPRCTTTCLSGTYLVTRHSAQRGQGDGGARDNRIDGTDGA